MKNECKEQSWEPARLIPVSGKQTSSEEEKRSTSALLDNCDG